MDYTANLWALAEELLSRGELDDLRGVASNRPLDYARLVLFDQSLGGSGIHNVSRGNSGAYAIEDRDVFRPLQYCSMIFDQPETGLRWSTREVVHMCGLHLEELVERVANGRKLTLGRGLEQAVVKEVLGPEGLRRTKRFLAPYNDAKHNFRPYHDAGFEDEEGDAEADHDGHLFTVEDAVVAYAVSRRLALPLYPHARLESPRSLWGPRSGTDPLSALET